jgi:hypothetical protein
MVGRVRKTFPGKGWSAQFQFRQEGKMIGIEGPRRSLREGAEADRKFVAASLDQAPHSSRVDAASCAIQKLCGRDTTSWVDAPGSASHTLDFERGSLKNMTQSELRGLASRTPGIMYNKKTSEGKWAHKSNKELIAELLAMKTTMPTQALPGRRAVQKRRASSLPGRAATKKTHPVFCDAQLGRECVRCQSLTASCDAQLGRECVRCQSLTASKLRSQSLL